MWGDQSKRDEFRHLEAKATAEAYAQEFSYNARNRNWWDIFWDGVNRMPRPIMALGTISLFVWCVIDPEQFVVSMKALQYIPEMLWYIFLAIIGFYFGGRMLDKAKPPAPRAPAVRRQRGNAGPGKAVLPEDDKDDWERQKRAVLGG